MKTRYAFFRQLFDYSSFEGEFNHVLDSIRENTGLNFTAGGDLSYVHKVWTDLLLKRHYLVSEPMHQITSHAFLGELCHLLARFDTVLFRGISVSLMVEQDFLDRELIAFIQDFRQEYVAVDMCAYLYRSIMRFKPNAYAATTVEDVKALCREMRRAPERGKSFVKALKYPTIFSLP